MITYISMIVLGYIIRHVIFLFQFHYWKKTLAIIQLEFLASRIMSVSGDEADKEETYNKGVEFIKSQGVKIEEPHNDYSKTLKHVEEIYYYKSL